MKFSCDTCHARYTIADEKVRGKILRVRCKKCGSSIVLKEPEEEPVEQQPVREDDATTVLKAEDIKRVLASPGAVAPAPVVSRSVQPESPRPPPAPTERPEWYILIQKEEIGPLRIDELRERAASGRVTPRTYIWRDGMANWARLQTVQELAEVLKLIPDSQQRPTVPPPPAPVTAAPLTSAVFTPAAATGTTPVPPLAGMVPVESGAETVSSTEVTPKDLFEKTILAPTAEARLVPAPTIDPSTLKTEVGTPSQEQTLPADPPQETAPLEETAPHETAPPEPSSNTATEPPFEAPETHEDDAPVLFGLDRNQVPVLAEAFKEPSQSDWDAPPEAAPETIPAPPSAAAAAGPLPSVMVDLGPGSDAFQTVRVYPSGNSTSVEIPSEPVGRVGRTAEKSAVPAPAQASAVEHSASFVEALRPRTGRRILAIAIPIAIVAILVGIYWMFGREPAKPAPVPHEFAGPPRPSSALPVAAVEPPPKPKKVAAPEEPSEPEPAPAPRPAPKVLSAEEAAFAAVQGDKNDRKLAIPTPAFLSHDEQELNTEAASAEIDEDLLARKVKQIYPAIQHCVTSEQHRNQNFKPGKVKVTIEIARSGSVSDVSFDKQAVADAGIGDCLRLAFKTIKMPPHEGEPANVEIPLFLQ